MERLLEYGVLGICVFALGYVCWKFLLVRLSSENDTLRADLGEARRREVDLLNEQINDFRDVGQSLAETNAKSRATIASATEVLHLVLERLSDDGDSAGS